MGLLGKEPTAVFAALFEMVKAAIPMLIIFGLIHWTGEQVAAVMLMVSVSLGFFNVLLTRSQVSSSVKTDALIQTALAMPEGTPIAAVKAAQEAKEGEL